MRMHKSITMDRLIEAAEENTWGMGSEGFCVKCGESQDGCEPDARQYTCESCGEPAVYGAEEIILCA
jgi:hypothetical protein